MKADQQRDINITIENRLVNRDINVYHHAARSAHMMGHGSRVTLPLRKPGENEDFLYVSVVHGPGRLENGSVVNLPGWLDFELSSSGNVTVVHKGERTLVKVPAGPPTWQLKITQAIGTGSMSDRITIGTAYDG